MSGAGDMLLARVHELHAARDQARADLAAAHTREAALRAAVERVRSLREAGRPLAAHGTAVSEFLWQLGRILDGTDQQPGDAT